MFSPRNVSLRTTTSPFTASPQGSKSVQSRKVASIFSQQRKPSRAQPNKSISQTAQVLEEASNLRIEKYGLPLPVLITEALTFADKSTRISVKTDKSGWAWLVGGRKLFIWRYKQAPAGRNILCKELTLPPSDLAHNASRVCVIPNNIDSQTASCIAVSPEGVVRYWPNIAYEASSMEISAELKGEECDSIVNLCPYGVLLATTTSSLVMISFTPGQNAVSCHPLKATQGMFSGIGRKMSSLIFGGGQGHSGGLPLQAAIAGNFDEDERPFYVLSGTHLSKWVIGSYNLEKFFYEIDADRLFREAFARKVWDKDAIQMTQLTTWLIDMQLSSDGVVILGAGLDTECQTLVHYAIATIGTDKSGTPSKLESFKVLDFVRKYQEENVAEVLDYRLLLPKENGEEVFLYNDSFIIIDKCNGETAEELSAPGGKLLGAGVCDNTAVFFSITQEMFSISSVKTQDVSILDDATLELVSKRDMSQLSTSTSQIQELSLSPDRFARFKAAFLSAFSVNMKQAQEIIDELFPDISVTAGNQTTDLDKLVLSLSRQVIDEIPTSDPRWAENVRSDSVTSTSSLIILQQLKDKQRVHDYIINFLKKLNLWDKLQTIRVGDHVTSTRLLLCQHAELLQAAVVLREMHSEYSSVMDPAIHKLLLSRGDQVPFGMSPHDVFYRQVSCIHDIIEYLLEYQREVMSDNLTPSDIIIIISSVNPIIEGMLHAALQYRQNKASVYQTGQELNPPPEYITWTSESGPSGIRTLLTKQFALTLESAVPEAKDAETQGLLFQQLLSLADFVLDGYTRQLDSLALNANMAEYTKQVEEKYLQDRHAFILPFLENDQYEKGVSLAEKYCDFEMLVRFCEVTNNQERIQRYQQQFAHKGFSDFLFSWYLKEGKRGRLLSMPSHGTQQQNQLQKFLQKDEFAYLKWLHEIECKDFKAAHETLLNLGRNEEKYLAQKKTLLSLSKLAALATGSNDDQIMANIRDIDEEQELILHQELLPAELLEKLNEDLDHMRVLSPVGLIELYICDENSSATEYDFKKALDLMQFLDMEDPAIDYNDIKTSICCKAILRDKAVWTHTPHGDPSDSLKDTIFFKTMSLAIADGWEPKQCFPDLNAILSSNFMTDIAKDKQFQFLLGAAYEMANSVAGTG